MQIQILAVGKLKDIVPDTTMVVSTNCSVFTLKNHIEKRFPDLKNLSYNIAINKQLANEHDLVPTHSEVVLLPDVG